MDRADYGALAGHRVVDGILRLTFGGLDEAVFRFVPTESRDGADAVAVTALAVKLALTSIGITILLVLFPYMPAFLHISAGMHASSLGCTSSRSRRGDFALATTLFAVVRRAQAVRRDLPRLGRETARDVRGRGCHHHAAPDARALPALEVIFSIVQPACCGESAACACASAAATCCGCSPAIAGPSEDGWRSCLKPASGCR